MWQNQFNPIKQCKFKWSRCRIKHFKSKERKMKEEKRSVSLHRNGKQLTSTSVRTSTVATLSEDLQFYGLKSQTEKRFSLMNGEWTMAKIICDIAAKTVNKCILDVNGFRTLHLDGSFVLVRVFLSPQSKKPQTRNHFTWSL